MPLIDALCVELGLAPSLSFSVLKPMGERKKPKMSKHLHLCARSLPSGRAISPGSRWSLMDVDATVATLCVVHGVLCVGAGS